MRLPIWGSRKTSTGCLSDSRSICIRLLPDLRVLPDNGFRKPRDANPGGLEDDKTFRLTPPFPFWEWFLRFSWNLLASGFLENSNGEIGRRWESFHPTFAKCASSGVGTRL